MASRCTEQAVQEFLRDRGGRVQQMELIDHFSSACGGNEPSKAGEVDAEALRRVVEAVGVVSVENGVKFVCLNAERRSAGSAVREDAESHDHAECNGNIQETRDSKCVNGNTTAATDNGDRTEASRPLEAMDNDKRSNGNGPPADPPQGKPDAAPPSAGGGEVKLRDRRRRESAPVIGVPDPDHSGGGSHSQQVRGARRVSKGSQRAVLTSCLSEDSALEGLEPTLDINTPKGSRRNFIELMMNSSPQVRRSLINRGSRLRDSMRSDGDTASILSSATDEDCASVTLDPLEHEWMLCASDGQWERLQPLLGEEPTLMAKRDFVTGFTCLHWAAKQGKAQLIGQLLTFAKENAVSVNVNVRSSAGYTPLHLAAMHGHTQVVRALLSDWEADPEARDYSGRRAIQYLPPPLAANLQEEGVVTSPGAESDNENTNGAGGGRGWRFPRVLQGNLNPLRLLNPPAEAAEEGAGNGRTKGGIQRKSSLSRLNARLHRGRQRAQIIHSASFRDSGEVGRGEELPRTPLRTRPLSNLFG